MIGVQRRKYVEFFRNSVKHQNLTLPLVDIAATPKHKKISLCTTCMNRLRDLRRTLPQNIADNLNYPQLEFVLLDYSSEDGLEKWVKQNMQPYIESGLLNFYRTSGHTRYAPSHSRNVSFRLAKGDVIVNVDADNFVGRGFARRINQCMALGDNIIAVPERFLLRGSDRLLLKGRFAIHKSGLAWLGGFDEDLDLGGGYSNEDLHFVLRAMISGFRVARFEDRYTTNRIETPEPERIKLMEVSGSYDEIKAINEKIISEKLAKGLVNCNRDRIWGHDTVMHNFTSLMNTEFSLQSVSN